MNQVFAIVVTYNPDLDLLTKQINSLIMQVEGIVIVDNLSINIDEIELISKRYNNNFNTGIELNRNLENVGLGKAQNLGIKSAMNMGATHVLLLDQDSTLELNFVDSLLVAEESLKQNEVRVGAIGSVYYNDLSGEVYPITKYIGPFIDRVIPDNRPVEATFIIASGSLISTNVLLDVGMMNEDLFIDYIDVEWAFRAKSKGYKVFAAPNAKMAHVIGDKRASVFGRSISVHSPLRRYYLYRNSISMIKDGNVDFGYKLREIVLNISRLIVFMVLADNRAKYLKYSLAGYWDGFRGVNGRCPYNW